MRQFIATFHTHLSALMTSRALTAAGAKAGMMPVPRKLSSSCGTCVLYEGETPRLELMDRDTEAVYEIQGEETYLRLYENK